MYRLIEGGAVATEDGATSFVPGSGSSADLAYQEWLAAGNAPSTTRKPAARFVLARDLIEYVLTADEIAAIVASVPQNATVARLWAMLMSRGEKPIDLDGDTVPAGVAVLNVLFGDKRTQAITADMRLRAKP